MHRNARRSESIRRSVQDTNRQEGRNARQANFTVRANAGTTRKGISVINSSNARKPLTLYQFNTGEAKHYF